MMVPYVSLAELVQFLADFFDVVGNGAVRNIESFCDIPLGKFLKHERENLDAAVILAFEFLIHITDGDIDVGLLLNIGGRYRGGASVLGEIVQADISGKFAFDTVK